MIGTAINQTKQPRTKKPKPMTNARYRQAIETLGFDQGTAAAFLDISIRSSNGYANGAKIPRTVQLLLELMIKHNIKPGELP